MPDVYRRERYVPRGVSNRRAALQWVKEHGDDNGVLFFLDDDNAVDIRLFEEMRSTDKVSMWPVGLIGDYTVSSPVVNEVGGCYIAPIKATVVLSLLIYYIISHISFHIGISLLLRVNVFDLFI